MTELQMGDVFDTVGGMVLDGSGEWRYDETEGDPMRADEFLVAVVDDGTPTAEDGVLACKCCAALVRESDARLHLGWHRKIERLT